MGARSPRDYVLDSTRTALASMPVASDSDSEETYSNLLDLTSLAGSVALALSYVFCSFPFLGLRIRLEHRKKKL